MASVRGPSHCEPTSAASRPKRYSLAQSIVVTKRANSALYVTTVPRRREKHRGGASASTAPRSPHGAGRWGVLRRYLAVVRPATTISSRLAANGDDIAVPCRSSAAAGCARVRARCTPLTAPSRGELPPHSGVYL